jgi:integrase
MRKTLTDRSVAALKPKAKRYVVPDPGQAGHYVRVMPSGTKTYAAVARDPFGKQIWATVGSAEVMPIGEARERARVAIGRIKEGLEPFEAPTPRAETFEHVAENWLKRHVEAKGLRSGAEIERVLRHCVYPSWKARPFVGIRRSHVAELLDKVEDEHGARTADYVLAIARGIANWYASRHDAYVPPFVRGMKRTDPKERERDRSLDDDELRAVWQAAQSNGTFGAFVRLALLTGQRREKLLTMRWTDIGDDGVWTIPTEEREKGNADEVKLPKAALDIIAAQPRRGDNPYVLAGRTSGPIRGLGQMKRLLDAKLPAMPHWQVHDLRRTARSLMSRAGVPRDIAERVLGHRVGNSVARVYDRHEYADEKAGALARLAALIERIVSGAPDNVVQITPDVVRRAVRGNFDKV